MSATLPPADFDQSSDFGEFWPHADAAPRQASVMPESESEPEVRSLPLSPEQHARRMRLRRAVGGVVLGLFAFTALAGATYVVKGRAAASSSAAPNEPVRAQAASLTKAAPLLTTPAPSEASHSAAPLDAALSLVHEPVATVANLHAWSRLAKQLTLADRQLVEHDLSSLSVGGARPAQEAARLELALLWRVTARRAKAQKVLVSLARTATDPVVKKYARETLTAV